MSGLLTLRTRAAVPVADGACLPSEQRSRYDTFEPRTILVRRECRRRPSCLDRMSVLVRKGMQRLLVFGAAGDFVGRIGVGSFLGIFANQAGNLDGLSIRSEPWHIAGFAL